jgi:hypothetical protein
VPRSGISKYRYHDELFESQFSEAVVTDNQLAVEVPDAGDVIILKATSTDKGRTYVGIYWYRGKTYPPGQVQFERERNSDGSDSFVGRRIETDRRDVWFLGVDPPE